MRAVPCWARLEAWLRARLIGIPRVGDRDEAMVLFAVTTFVLFRYGLDRSAPNIAP